MEHLTEMVDFEISFNRLEEFMVDVLKWKKLDKLHLMHNNISSYNYVVWTHTELTGLSLANNKIQMPIGKIYMPWLTFLALDYTKIVLTNTFGADTTPNLLYLYLSGNPLKKFPEKSLKANLIHLGVRECNLKLLPPYLSTFKELRYLDARDNNISIVDNDLKKLA
jgi:Leucine-rich repeat (LRR) protein